MKKYTFKDFIGELEKKIENKNLYKKINYKENLQAKTLLKKAYENKIQNKTFNECNEDKILVILYYLKNIRNFNFEVLKTLCQYLSKEDLKEFKKIQLSNKLDLSMIEELKNSVFNMYFFLKRKNSLKKAREFKLLKEYLTVLSNLSKVDQDLIFKKLIDNELSLEKFKFFGNNLHWLANKPEVLFLIKKTPLKTLKKLQKAVKE